MGTRILTGFVLVSMFTSVAIAQPGDDSLIDSLRSFEQQFRVGSFRFDGKEVYRQGPAWADGTVIVKQQGAFRRDARNAIHMETIQSRKDEYHGIAYEIPDGIDEHDIRDRYESALGMIFTPGSSVSVNSLSSDSGRIDRFVPRGTLLGNAGSPEWHSYTHPLNFLLGFEEYLVNSETRFSDLLSSSPMEIEDCRLNGCYCWCATTETPQGTLRVWFSQDQDLVPLQFELERTASDLLTDGGRYDGLHTCDAMGYCFGKKEPAVTVLRHTYSNIKYCTIGSNQVCCGFVFERREDYSNGQQALIETTVTLSKIDLGAPEIKSHSVDFELFTIPDKTIFMALDSPQVPYMISGGEICKVVNEKTLESLDGVRFAMPDGRSWLPLISCVALIVVFGALFFYKQKRSVLP